MPHPIPNPLDSLNSSNPPNSLNSSNSPNSPNSLDPLIQQLLKYQTHLSHLLDRLDPKADLDAYIRTFDIYSRNALYISQLILDRHHLNPTPDTLTLLLNQALDDISLELDLDL